MLRSVFVAGILVMAGCTEPRAGESFVVLLYHHVAEDTPRITSVTPAEFEAHLDYLDDNGFQVWPLERAVEALEGGESVPDRTIAITFDDAYTDIRTNAVPLLEERGWPYTVFVATKAVDEGQGGIMDWDELRELQQRGATLANHTHTHDHLIRRHEGESESAWLARVREDIETAARRLREETGMDNDLFAWPYGEYNLALDELAQDLDLVAFTQASGAVGALQDRQRLPRFPVAGNYASIEDLADKLSALPLPVTGQEPKEPERPADDRRPMLEFEVAEGPFDMRRLTCFVSGQGSVEPSVSGNGPHSVRLQAPRPLPAGRSRYNCTVPAEAEDRFYWYSHPWFIPKPNGEWPAE
jgi:peptidoglycan/xylan/chitin deacetylase (PgdA/CDA1 family)